MSVAPVHFKRSCTKHPTGLSLGMQLKRILVPIDFSEQTPLAVREADQLAKERGGTVTLFHVHEIVELAFMDFTYVEPPAQLQAACDAAETRLRDIAGKMQTPPERVHVEVATGSPISEIINASQKHDLVVMPTHGRKGISHFLMGSVAERVVRGAKCGVLVVKGSAT